MYIYNNISLSLYVINEIISFLKSVILKCKKKKKKKKKRKENNCFRRDPLRDRSVSRSQGLEETMAGRGAINPAGGAINFFRGNTKSALTSLDRASPRQDR